MNMCFKIATNERSESPRCTFFLPLSSSAHHKYNLALPSCAFCCKLLVVSFFFVTPRRLFYLAASTLFTETTFKPLLREKKPLLLVRDVSAFIFNVIPYSLKVTLLLNDFLLCGSFKFDKYCKNIWEAILSRIFRFFFFFC